MYSSSTVESLFIVLLVAFLVAIPGHWPLILWIHRSNGDPVVILTQRPALPWWGRGFTGQLAAFLTLQFWLGVAIGLAVSAGESLFGFELSDKAWRLIRCVVVGASAALAMQLYQRAGAIALPPHFNRAEKKALNKLTAFGNDREAAAAYYQQELKRVFEEPTPLTAQGVNFRDPQSSMVLAEVGWDQVVCVPKIFTKEYFVICLSGSAPQILRKLAHGSRPGCYRLYYSGGSSLVTGMKMQALARRLWADNRRAPDGGYFTDALGRKAADIFD